MIGHRGAAGLAPENTLVSFHRARADGADVLELDVHATVDGEIVVLHDATIDRTTDGTGPVNRCAWADLQRHDAGFHFTPDGGRSYPYRGQGVAVPRLVDLIRSLPDMPLNVEIKQEEPSIVDAVVRIARAAPVTVVLAAEHDTIMTAIRQAAPDLPTSLAAGEVAEFHGALERGASPTLPSATVALQIPPRFGEIELVTEASVAAAHACGAEMHVWTINDSVEMERLLALGCDGIVTDFPGRARRLFDARATPVA